VLLDLALGHLLATEEDLLILNLHLEQVEALLLALGEVLLSGADTQVGHDLASRVRVVRQRRALLRLGIRRPVRHDLLRSVLVSFSHTVRKRVALSQVLEALAFLSLFLRLLRLGCALRRLYPYTLRGLVLLLRLVVPVSLGLALARRPPRLDGIAIPLSPPVAITAAVPLALALFPLVLLLLLRLILCQEGELLRVDVALNLGLLLLLLARDELVQLRGERL
jgi:hypothetical protein